MNCNGATEIDAIIMVGKNLASGAVSAVKCAANPVKLCLFCYGKGMLNLHVSKEHFLP